MGKKIYAVSSGDYSDYSVEAIFTTKKKAENYIKSWKPFKVDFNDIELYELDPPNKIQPKDGLFPFLVRMDNKFNVSNSVYASEYILQHALLKKKKYELNYLKEPIFNCYLMAKDEKHAIKICKDELRQIIATVGYGNLIE